MSMYDSQTRMNTLGQRSGSRPDLSGASFRNDCGPMMHVGGNGYQGEYNDGYNQVYTTYSKSSMHGGGSGGGGHQKMVYSTVGGGGGGGGGANVIGIQNKALFLHSQCQEYLQRAQHIISTGGPAMEVEKLLSMSSESLEQLRRCATDLQQLRVPHDLFRSVDELQHMQGVIQQNMAGGMGTTQRWNRGSLTSMDDSRSYSDAMGWIGQQKRLIETAPWGDDAEALDQQTISHNKFHNSIQRSTEVDRARDELNMNRDKPRLNTLEQEWSSLQKMSNKRFSELHELQGIIQEISQAIMWVNEREEEELVFDWGDKNIEQYIPRKQEGYSKMMSALEEKEKELNKLKTKVDGLLNNNHPASDKIEAYMDTLQTQWSWLLQITKCIHVHLKENGAYHQFFKDANETYGKLQKQHEHVRNKFTCDKQTPLESLQDLLKDLEKEKEKIMENKRQVQSLVTKSKSIVRLRPRNPEERSSSTVMVQALCDFKQDQKSILKGNEGILKDNSQRSKWLVTGPGGLDMLIPSVCLLIPPPNPLSIGLANKNEQYYEAIMGIWNQLYINIKSLIAWQYCVKDINYINSLTLTMLSKMRPDEYRSVIKRLETHYQEFLRTSQGSELFGEEEQKNIKGQFAFAQNHYDGLIVQLPTYTPAPPQVVPVVKPTVSSTTETVKVVKITTPPPAPAPSTLSLTLLNDLDALRRRLEVTESTLTFHLHLPLGENGVRECSLHLQELQVVTKDLDALHDEYIRLRERILKQLDGIPADSEQAKYLRSQLDYINVRIRDLQGLNNSYFNRLSCLKGVLQNMTQVQDVVQMNEVMLTEKDTTSLDTREVDEYRTTLKQMKLDLDQKRDLLSVMDSELASAVQYNSQISQNFHKCDVDLTKYAEQVGQLNDRWSRIRAQIERRLWDLEKQDKELRHYQKTSGNLETWIDNTRIRQDSLQTVKFTDIQALMDHLNQQKVLYNEIKGKQEKVEDVQKDAEICASSIKDYELQLASYSAGLETLLHVPIKRTMLKSPASTVRQEATLLHSSYVELLTRSGDYHKFLGEMLKSMEELKMRNTKIELLEEELRRLKESFQDRNHKNQSLEDALARYKLELNQSKEKLISLEEVKMTSAIQVSATRESLDSTQNQLKDLKDKLSRLQYQLDEEVRKRRLAEERYNSQQEEYESAVRRRQKELEEVNWSKIDLEKLVKDKERELERLKIQLEEEAARRRGAESEMSKTSMMIHESKSSFTELKQEKEGLLSKMKMMEQDKIRQQRIEEELTRIKLSLETELRNKQRLTEENTSVRKDLAYFKSQYELRDSEKRQGDSDRDRADRERASLKSEVERLTRELRTLEETYKSQRLISEKESREMTLRRQTLEKEILMLQQRPCSLTRQTQTSEKVSTIDPSKLLFDGVRRKVTAHQLCDCGIISKSTLEMLLSGRKTVEEVAVDIQLSLKGTGIIAGMTRGAQGKMPFTEAKTKGQLSPECALMLLESQAATGYIVDPAFNDKMPVDTACTRGLVDAEDRDVLLTAEAASTGFKDPFSGKLLSVGQVLKQGRIDKQTAIRLLQAQESVGGIIDPVLGVFLPKDLALDRNLIDEDLYVTLNKKPACYLDPTSGNKISYSDLKLKCKIDSVSGLLLLPGEKEKKSMTVKGLRGEVTMTELVASELLSTADLEKVNQGTLTSQDIEDRLKNYLYGSSCIAGIYDEAKDRTMPFYMAMKEGLIMRGTTLELLEAQAASGFMIDPVNNVFLTVEEAVKRGVVGNEFKKKLISAEKAVVGYTDPETGNTISLFQAIDKDLIEKGHGIRLLEAQIASGGIIDPKESHRIEVGVAYRRGYFNEEMNEILTYEGDDTKGFFDPNTKENLTYLQLKERCIKDPKTGLLLLALRDKSKKTKDLSESRKNVLRKRRVVIVDPDTGLEMSVREAYHRELIDYDTFLDLSEQECEWEEITVKGENGSVRVVLVDKKTGTQYDINEYLERGAIDQASLDKYRSGNITLTEFADLITQKSSSREMSITASTAADVATCTSPTQARPSSPTVRKRFNSISITLSPAEMFDDLSPVGAIFDTETLEKITISEGCRRGIVDNITAQRLLEAQASTGGIINPSTSQRLSLQDAVHQSIIDEDMAPKLKASQKAFTGFEDVKSKRKMSAAEAMKEKWLPYEAGQRFLEFQYLTGGLLEPGSGRRISIEEAIRRKWLDGREAQKLQDTQNHQKNLTCPKTKLKISYKQAMDGCMVEESNGMKMLQATSISSKGISSPYNVSNPGSRSGSRQGSRAGSRAGSRRGSVDYSSSYSLSISSSSVNKSFSNSSLS